MGRRSNDGTAPPAAKGDTPPPVGFGEAVVYWLRLGCVGFGGPAGQIALMHADLVERRQWLSEHRFLHALNYCMLLPGPEAQQLATYIGWLMHGTRGGIVAGVLFVLPSLFILVGLSWVYMAFGNVPAVAGVFYGIKPAVTAIVLTAACRLGARTLRSTWRWGVAGSAFVAIAVLHMPFPLVVLAAAAIGFLRGRRTPDEFSDVGTIAASTPPTQNRGSVPFADEARPPPATRFTWRWFLRGAAVGVGLWVSAIAGLGAAIGWHGVLTQMAWFFTKAALVTFGGAYAVLPYVVQGAVDEHQWLSARQMIDGLALGETTPGPLIMVVAFVGFVGGWSHGAVAAVSPFVSGASAAAVATFFTFLPSFCFVLLGAPLIESTRGNVRVLAPLAGITAAVVGVIANLALFFAYHVLWPQGLGGRFEWSAALIGIAAVAALWRYHASVVTVVAACGLAGLAIVIMTGAA